MKKIKININKFSCPEDEKTIIKRYEKEIINDEGERENLEKFMKNNGLRFDQIIFGAPMGERILINDDKPSGLRMAYAINKKRDAKLNLHIVRDEKL